MIKNRKITSAAIRRKGENKVHLIGICGAGMSALAVLLKESGWQVTGTNEGNSGSFASHPFAVHLKKNKIRFNKKYNKKNIPKNADLVVVGNNALLAEEVNPETRYAIKRGYKINSLPEALASLSKNKENILVVGSFGKSTVATLVSWCLYKAKKDPSYFIGALPINLKNSSHMGKGREFVIEGDEYTSSKTDSKSKFLHFDPKSVILISGEHDHINAFPTEALYKATYKKLMLKIPKNGLLVYALYGKNNKEISLSANCKKVSYGIYEKSENKTEKNSKRPGWYAQNVKYGMRSSFDLMHKGKKIKKIETPLLGRHNIENIVGAGALLLEQKKITSEVFAKAIKIFHGVKDRIELKNKNSKIPVYQGFGSSYEKAKAVFDTMRLHFPKQRIVTIFEPYAFSWRNRKFLKWYKNIFDNVDEVVMLPATGHGKKVKDQLTIGEVWAEVKKHRKNVYFIKNEKEGLGVVKKIIKKGDVVTLVSSGSMLGLADSISKLIDKKF